MNNEQGGGSQVLYFMILFTQSLNGHDLSSCPIPKSEKIAFRRIIKAKSLFLFPLQKLLESTIDR